MHFPGTLHLQEFIVLPVLQVSFGAVNDISFMLCLFYT
jgi:hypothetical protein